MELNGQKYLLTVGLLDNCPYPVILGQDVPILTELLQGANTATGYVLTRAQAREKTDSSVWSELSFGGQGGKPKKSKAERRRANLVGTAVPEDLPFPPLEGSNITSADFGKLQQEDPTISSCLSSVKSPVEAEEILNE